MLRTIQVIDNPSPTTDMNNASVDSAHRHSIAIVPLIRMSSKLNKCFIINFFKGVEKSLEILSLG